MREEERLRVEWRRQRLIEPISETFLVHDLQGAKRTLLSATPQDAEVLTIGQSENTNCCTLPRNALQHLRAGREMHHTQNSVFHSLVGFCQGESQRDQLVLVIEEQEALERFCRL